MRHDKYREEYNDLFGSDKINSIEDTFSNFKKFNDIDKLKEFIDNIKYIAAAEYDENFEISDIIENYVYSIRELLRFFDIFEHIGPNTDFDFKEIQYKADYIFSFTFLKILDGSMKFSKQNSISESSFDNLSTEKNLNYFTYPTGEELGFYNLSKWDLESLVYEHLVYDDVNEANNILYHNLKDYLNGFSDPIGEIFEGLKLNSSIDFLKENNLLLFFIIGLYVTDLNECVFENSAYLKEFYISFIEHIRYGRWFNLMAYPYFFAFSERPNSSFHILPQLLFSGIDLEGKKEISIFDPASEEGDLLLECLKQIKMINPNCVVKLYGCSSNFRAYALCLSKMLLLKIDTDNFYFFNDWSLLFNSNFLNDKMFDFIVSDLSLIEFRQQQSYKLVILPLSKLIKKCHDRLVIFASYETFSYIRHRMEYYILEDKLESIIHLPFDPEYKKEFIFVMNNNKSNFSKDRFLLIDEAEDSEYYYLTKLPSKIVNRVLNSFKNFKEYEKGKVFFNSQVDEFFNFQHLMFNDKFSLNKSNTSTFYLGDLVEFETHLPTIKKSDDYDLFFIPMEYPNLEKYIHYSFNFYNDEGKFRLKPIGLNLKSEKILIDYLYYYLNSNKGRHALSYFTKDLSWVFYTDIYYVPIPVPSIEEQEKIIEVARNMEEFFNAMDIWKNDYSNDILNYQPALESYKNFTCTIEFDEAKEFCKNWRIVYQGLAWPLAYSYLKATKGSNDNSIKKKNYLVLFEFLAAFNVTVLISGINEYLNNGEEYEEIMDSLWKLYHGNLKTWHTMHFGGWTTLYSRLTKIYKNYAFSTEFDKDFLFDLSQKKYKNLFHKLRDKERNSEAHSGLEDAIDVNIKMQDLEVYMNDDIFSILKIYSGFKFYYVISGTDISPKKKSYDVQILNGPCDYPHSDNLITDKKLDSQCLYFYNPLNDAFLKIDNDLMKFRIIPDTKQYAIYIYNKIDVQRNIAIYRAFHLRDEVWEIPLKTDEDTYFKVSEEFLKYVLRLNSDE